MNEAIIARILKAYSRNDGKENPSDMWEYCVRRSKEVDLTTENLDNMGNSTLVTGFFGITATPDDNEALRLLAEALGVRGIQNPEGAVNPAPICNKPITNTELLAGIKKAIGIDLKMPEFYGNKSEGLNIQGEFITARHCYYLLLLKRILDYFPNRNTSIIEIGAGIGLLGYFLDQCGYKDYTIIDLARTNTIQAYFLHKNLPERRIILSGEVVCPFTRTGDIKILHVSDFMNLSSFRYELMVSMDGLTEMKIEDAKDYINSDCAFHFLSVNHEQNDFRAIEIYDPETRILKYRYPFHVRPGYVEEMYQLKL
jgi:hypothetical protein